jgi:hypothetical protein
VITDYGQLPQFLEPRLPRCVPTAHHDIQHIRNQGMDLSIVQCDFSSFPISTIMSAKITSYLDCGTSVLIPKHMHDM